MPRDLRALPRAQMGVKLPPELGNLLADALQLQVGIAVARQAAQFVDIFFEMLDHLLALGLLLIQFVFFFLFCSHAPTEATA